MIKYKPDYVIKGKEHEYERNEELKVLEKLGGKLIFAPGDITFRSSGLIKDELKLEKRDIGRDENAFLKRHKITKHVCSEYLSKIKKVRAIVIGDSILDEYISCEAIGMSQEDPTIAVKPIDHQIYLGGAAIVAGHGASLGANVKFISVAGKDKYAKILKVKLKKLNMKYSIFDDISRPTCLKKRYRANDKTLLRVNNIQQNSISMEIQNKIFRTIKKDIRNVDIIILSDFNYGCLPQTLVNKITKLAYENNINIVADSQSSSQIGDIARFKDMNLITPTEREARLSTKDNESGVVEISKKLNEMTNSENIILKLGKEGLIIFAYKDKKIHTDRIIAMNQNPIDVAGAGDVLLIISSLVLCLGGSIWLSAYLGSIAASIQVGKLGNKPLNMMELKSQI